MEKNAVEDIFEIDQEESDNSKEDIKEDIKENIKEDVKQESIEIESNSEVERLKKEIEKLTKQESDTKKWGNENREVYMRAKRKTEELSKKLYEDGILFEEDYEVLSKVFERNLDEDSATSIEPEITPIKKVVDNLKNTFEEYKKWSDESDLDYKFNAFYKDLELATDKRFKEIQEYMLSESDPKVLLKYVLDKGTKSFNKLYKPISEKGDALSYVEELLTKNEKLEKEIKELRFELDDTEERVYNKSTKNESYRSNKNDVVDDLFGV